MGGYRWAQCAALTLFASAPLLASERVVFDPYIKAGPGYTAATGSLTGYVPAKSVDQLLLESTRKGWLGSAGSSTKTPFELKPKVSIPLGGLIDKLKTGLKASAPDLMMSAAVSAAVAGVGWVMSDDNTKLQVKSDTVDGIPVSGTATSDNNDACSYPATQVLNKIKVVTNSNNVTYAIAAFPSGTVPGDGIPSGYTHLNNCTSKTLGFDYNHATGYWPVSAYRLISIGEMKSVKIDLKDADWTMLDPWVNAQGADWLKGLLGDVCDKSPNPQQCFDDLQKQSKAIITGPARVNGPSSTTTGTYKKPDGTTGTTATTTTTTYDLAYGDESYDVTTTKTATTTQDGQPVSQETTTDAGSIEEQPQDQTPEDYSFTDSDLPEVPSFYEPQYPDGLKGVWETKKTELDGSSFLQFLRSFIPSFSGTCPSWSLPFDMGFISFGNHGFGSICYALDFVGIVFLVTAAFTARALIFGG